MPNFSTKKSLPFLSGLGVLLLTSCGAGAVNVEPAVDAANPNCAYAMVAMPKELAGLAQRETTAQATTAWGNPADVILKCGIQITTPVSDPCAEVNGVDWIVKPTDSSDSSAETATGTWTATTFGRNPDIRVTFNANKVSSSTILAELSSAVKQLNQTKKCTNVADTLNGVSASSAPRSSSSNR